MTDHGVYPRTRLFFERGMSYNFQGSVRNRKLEGLMASWHTKLRRYYIVSYIYVPIIPPSKVQASINFLQMTLLAPTIYFSVTIIHYRNIPINYIPFSSYNSNSNGTSSTNSPQGNQNLAEQLQI